MRSSLVSSLVCVVFVAACSHTPAPQLATWRPSEVRELSSLPAGYQAGQTLRASCLRAPRGVQLDDAALPSVDCNEARLSRALRASAGELGARFVTGKQCRARGGKLAKVSCSVTLALPGPRVGFDPHVAAQDPGPAPRADEVEDWDEPRPQDSAQIRVAYLPTALGTRAGFAARRYDAVAETHRPAVGRAELGQVSARCRGCDTLRLRHALRVTAGHAGAGEVSEVKCFLEAGDQRCVATALAPWSS